jgi:hypothetical protein
MGSGVSTLPDELTQEEVLRVCGNKFNQVEFDKIKNEAGMCSKENFIALLQHAQEDEVNKLFLRFSPSGQMDSRTFVKMMKDTKILNSKTFTNVDADLAFTRARTKLGPSAKSIPYELFRESCVVDIAEKKGCTAADILFELSRAEGPVLNGTTQVDNVRLHDAPVRRGSTGVVNTSIPKLDEIKKSATKHDDLNTDYLFPLFMQFCPGGELDSKTFVKFMNDADVIDKSFTTGDCDIIFQKVKFTISSNNPGAYSASSQVKKISFDHFVHIALICVAEKKGMTMQALIDSICVCQGPTSSGTVAGANRFHDDKSTYPISALGSSDAAGHIKPSKSHEGSPMKQPSTVGRSPSKSASKEGAIIKAAEEIVVRKMASIEGTPSRRGSRLSRSASLEELDLSQVPAGI